MRRGRRIAFHAAAGPNIGGGHLVRCMALADALRERGWDCLLVCEEAAAPILDWLPSGSVELALVPPDDKAAVLEEMSRAGVAVVDNYDWTADDELALGETCRHVAVIDERLDRFHDVDLVVDMTPSRNAREYSGLVSDRCSLLLGSEYALLRRVFPDNRDAVLTARAEKNGVVQRVLIALGASAGPALYERCLAAVGAVESGLAVDVVVGTVADTANLARVATELHNQGRAVTIHHTVEDMAAMMAAADLAIGAAGVSTWERCCFGLPSVVMQTADNQSANVDALRAAEAAIVVSNAGGPTLQAQLTRSIDALISDHARMRDMSVAAAALCDGRGASRVADWIDSRWSGARI